MCVWGGGGGGGGEGGVQWWGRGLEFKFSFIKDPNRNKKIFFYESKFKINFFSVGRGGLE